MRSYEVLQELFIRSERFDHDKSSFSNISGKCMLVNKKFSEPGQSQ